MLVQSTIKIEYSEVSSSKEEKQIQHYEGEAFLTVLEEKYEGEKTKRCRRSEEFENKKVLKLKTEKFIIKKFPTKHGVRVTKFKFKDKNLGPKIKKAELKSKQKDFLWYQEVMQIIADSTYPIHELKIKNAPPSLMVSLQQYNKTGEQV